jgi:hypothetical protein
MLKKLLLLFASRAIEDVIEQDAIADSLVSDLPGDAAAEAEPEEAVETGDEAPLEEEGELEAAGDQADEDWLPGEQEKVFPDEVLERYASRYPALLKVWQDGNQPQELRDQARQILHDKLNGDIRIQQLTEAQPLEEEEEDQPLQATQEQKLPTREEYFNTLRQTVRSRTDPQVAKDFYTQFNKVWGLSDQQIAQAIRKNPNAPQEFTELMTTYGLNMVNTFADQLIWDRLTPMLEQVFPGFGDMYSRSANAMAWDRVRNSADGFNKLPAFGTREFSTQARKAATQHFGSDEDFENAQFSKVVNGQRTPLSQLENAQKKYAILAKIMAGQTVDPRLIQQAVKTGAKQNRRQQVSRQAGLGRGGTRAEGAPRGQGDDLFSDGLKLWQQEHGRL